MFKDAIVRQPSENFANGLTTAANPDPPVYDLMKEQHAGYIDVLKAAGLNVTIMDAEPDYPDAHFVEDTAVVMPEIAIITNPGANSRRGEQDTIEPVLADFRPIEHIMAPGTMDGGDVLQIGSRFFVGISERTNKEGSGQFAAIIEKFGYTMTAVPVGAGLHFKSSVNHVGDNALLVTNVFAGYPQLQEFDLIATGAGEAYASNTLFINDRLIVPAGYPRTKRKLETLGFEIIELDVSEVSKMDGGLTCLSLRF